MRKADDPQVQKAVDQAMAEMGQEPEYRLAARKVCAVFVQICLPDCLTKAIEKIVEIILNCIFRRFQLLEQKLDDMGRDLVEVAEYRTMREIIEQGSQKYFTPAEVGRAMRQPADSIRNMIRNNRITATTSGEKSGNYDRIVVHLNEVRRLLNYRDSKMRGPCDQTD